MSFVYCGWLDSALQWVLRNVISPVFNCIKSVLNSVFSFIYGNVLGPILDKTVYAAARKIGDIILDAIFKALYALAKMALQILDCLSDLFDTLLGVQNVIFKGEETTLLRAFLNMDGVRRAFWYINFFALGLAVIFAIYGVTRSMLDFDFENKRPVSRVMSSLLSSVLNLFTVQLTVFGIIYLAEAILTGLNSALSEAGGGGNTTLGRMIFVLGTLNAANDENLNISSNAVQSGSTIVGPKDTVRIKFYETSGLSPYKLSDVQNYFNIRKLDYFVLIGLGLVFSFLLLIALISVVRRLFNLLLLYIVSPLFAATIPLDDGEHFAKWRNLFVGTCFTGYGMLVAMKLYLLICPSIMGSEITMSSSVELNYVCKVVFLLGGLWAVYKSSSMITGLVSAEAAGAEQESMGKGFEVAGWAGANMIKALKSGNKDKDKDKEKDKEGKDGKEGEGSQRFNGKNSGAAGSTEHGKDNAFKGDAHKRNDKLEGAGKKDKKSKDDNNLFKGKAKPGSIGRTGAENRTMDKMRSKFGMDNADGLDKANKAETEQNKDRNAFQGGRGKTTDSRGLGAKSMDAMRSKFGFDTTPKAAGAADAQKESGAEQALNGQNKPGAGAGSAGGKQGKLEGNKTGAQKTGGVAAAAGGSRAKDDSGYMEMHDTLPKQNVTDAGRFSGKIHEMSGLGGQSITQEEYLNLSQKTMTSGTTEQNGVSQSHAGSTFDNKQTFAENNMGSQSYTGVTNNNQSINKQTNAGSNNTYNDASTMFNQNQTNYVNNTDNKNSIGGGTNVHNDFTGSNISNNSGNINNNINENNTGLNNNVVNNRFTISNESKDVQNNTFEMNSPSYGNINSLGEVTHYTDNESPIMSKNQFVDNGNVDYNNINFSQGINEEIRTGANYIANEGSIHETVRVNRVQNTDAFTVDSSRPHVETSMESNTNVVKNDTEKIHENAKKESNKKENDKK